MPRLTMYALLMSLLSCFRPASGSKPVTPDLPPDPERFRHYTGSRYEGNYVWSGAMNLCWTALSQTLIGGPIALKGNDTTALQTADHLNHPVCTTADLDAPSYYVKAGFGPGTVATINREQRERFPQASFGDLNLELKEEDIVSYAYFYKNVAYETPFSKDFIYFEGQRVAGFGALEKAQKKTVQVLHYESNDRFILALRLKDPADALILAKGYDTQHPEAVLTALEAASQHTPQSMTEEDVFQMPLLKLDMQRDYTEMIGQGLANKGFESYFIGQMFENIAFQLDETGAKVESRAVISVERSLSPSNRRYLLLNKPFWVIMKRADRTNPYFLLGVNHTNIMQPI